jgi:hypothetical protein
MTLVTPRSILSIKPPLYQCGSLRETVYPRCLEVYKIALTGAYSLISLAAAAVAVVAAAVFKYSGT